MTQYPLFVVSRDDWSLHRKGQIDQERHQEKVKEAIKNNLSDIVSEESIIMSNGKDKIKVPIRSIEQYKFRFSNKDEEQVGQGNGSSNVGDVIGQQGQEEGQGKEAGQAGDKPGEDIYEAEISIDELAELIFEDLQLPNLQSKPKGEQTTDHIEFTDIRKKGIMSNVDKKRTILESMKRQARNQAALSRIQIEEDDLRFKTWEIKEKPITNAVILAMMDTSASMGTFEKYIARSFYFWMVRFLRTNYQKVEIVFLAHDTNAKEVSEEQFFTRGESGGTKCSSVYKLANRIVNERYPPEYYNTYAFHFSDGDNWPDDNRELLTQLEAFIPKCNMTGYGEINPYHRTSTLLETVKKLEGPAFVTSIIRNKKEVYQALKTFFGDRMQGEKKDVAP